MRRVLVPLDGSSLAETILPDAARLAGVNGTLVLVRFEAPDPYREGGGWISPSRDRAAAYLADVAARLHLRIPVEAEVRVQGAEDLTIQLAVDDLGIDIVAAATPQTGGVHRRVHSSTAWRLLQHSSVPVLLRCPHGESDGSSTQVPDRRTIMVPLDGSTFSESVLELVETLSLEWKARILLTRVVPRPPLLSTPMGHPMVDVLHADLSHARDYLNEVAEWLPGEVATHVVAGDDVPDALVRVAQKDGVTDIILSSHGRTGIAHAVLGSVAEAVIQRVACPVLVLPARALHEGEYHPGGAGAPAGRFVRTVVAPTCP